jgi:hypothetical protein
MSRQFIKMTIPDSGKGNPLLLESFCEFLKNLGRILQHIDRSISHSSQPTTEYIVHSLQKNSPAAVEMEVVSKKIENTDFPKKIVDKFWTLLESVNNKEDLGDWEPDILESWVSFAKDNSKLGQPITFALNNGVKREISLNLDSESYLKEWLGTEIITWGVVQGYLEGIDIHQTPKITIYPIVGAKKIKCTFGKEKLEIIKRAIGQYVEVTGMVHYRKDQYFPYKVELQEIEVYPPEDKTLSLNSFRGILGDITNGVDPVEYVRALRDDE